MWNSGRLPSISATVSPLADAELGEPAGEGVDPLAQLAPGQRDLVVFGADRDAVPEVLGGEPEGFSDRGGRGGPCCDAH